MSDATLRREGLASAWLLGHASDEEAREFEQLYRSDGSFRELVSEMETFLAPLSEDAPDVEPPADLLDDIMREIGEAPSVEEASVAMSQDSRRKSLSGAVPQRPWQYATAASLLIAAIATGLHFVPGAPEAPQDLQTTEELLALMSPAEAPSVVVLLYDSQTNRITGRLSNTALPQDGVWQLWLLRDGLDGPQSLGLLQDMSARGLIDLQIATELLAGSDTLAISLEPEGGSPEAGPTGPIVYTGKVDPI